MSKLSKNSKRILGVAAACLMLAGWSASSQARDCVVTNWLGGQPGLSDGNAGKQDTQATSNRRYAGHCGLRVPVDGTPRFVTDNSPAPEDTYIARFYVFLDNAGSDEIVLFSADDGTDAKVQIVYNAPTSGDLTLEVVDSSNDVNELTFDDVGAGWHSVEFAWEALESATIAFSLNGSDDLTNTINTSGIALANANLGNVSGAGSAGTNSIDFDDFDSRRSSRPGRLCRGLTNLSRSSLDLQDALNIFDEFASNGNTPADGQPDYNEDGVVDFDDALLVFSRFASGNEDCASNL
ncbi:hypothetical protein [Wenzhouxiangella limi]|uniref:Uncharacterized protein n=1 Tax=Wenzhouxiangella limi TaxID=2707351 RepID=A0A845UW31_9GAMM|nr:hypothetical protein [Wenzhouxiangella limi]NDY96043.1 hypothetical protein [Wenzhouxiangella limi]